jgi:hypothetical protein
VALITHIVIIIKKPVREAKAIVVVPLKEEEECTLIKMYI